MAPTLLWSLFTRDDVFFDALELHLGPKTMEHEPDSAAVRRYGSYLGLPFVSISPSTVSEDVSSHTPEV